MRYPKEWKCNRCKKKQDKHNIVRIRKCIFGAGRYQQFYQDFAVDLCQDCYDELLRDLLEVKLERNEEYYED